MGENFYTYSNPYNNCQTYVYNIVDMAYKLDGLHMPENIRIFILQDLGDILTGHTRFVSNYITDLGHFFNRIKGNGDNLLL
jgi:hypothetical protein